MRGRWLGIPHSDNPASAASTELIERARLAVLAHFNAPPEEYAATFTPNATGACRLIGEAYPFGPRTRLILTQDNHNSVNGIREFARPPRTAGPSASPIWGSRPVQRQVIVMRTANAVGVNAPPGFTSRFSAS